jgi:adrenodoxin-NADP+ reductase
VDIFEEQPFPYGLVRYGVAPDHPEAKNVIKTFEAVLANPRTRFFGNTKIGRDPTHLPLKVLRDRYDSTVVACGASENRRLNVEGDRYQRLGLTSQESAFVTSSLHESLSAGTMVILLANNSILDSTRQRLRV